MINAFSLPKLLWIKRHEPDIWEKTAAWISPKDYLSRLVKDYESFVSLSDSLGEEISFSSEEVRDIVSRMLRILFPEKSPANLSSQEKCRAAVELSDRYRLSARDLSLCLRIPEHMILQILRSKDYGKGR